MSGRAGEEVRFQLDLKVGVSKVPETGEAGQFGKRTQPIL